jgi:hypothetical protein
MSFRRVGPNQSIEEDLRKIPSYADEMDLLDVVGENAGLQHEQAVEKRELDWLKTNKIQ